MNGRLYLVGGETAEGPYRLYHQRGLLGGRGRWGQWYSAPYSLPASGTGFSAALYEGKAWVVGGGSTAAYSAEPGSNELLGSWATGYLSGAAVSLPCPGFDGRWTHLVRRHRPGDERLREYPDLLERLLVDLFHHRRLWPLLCSRGGFQHSPPLGSGGYLLPPSRSSRRAKDAPILPAFRRAEESSGRENPLLLWPIRATRFVIQPRPTA